MNTTSGPFTKQTAAGRLIAMAFLDSWRVGFELELILGDLDDLRFAPYADDPMDIASPAFCRAVATELSMATGRRWLAAHKMQRRVGYFVYPEYDLDPLNWPAGLVAGVELVTPPLRIADAEILRTQISNWVDRVDGHINTYHNEWAHCSGWHLNIDPGDQYKNIDECRMLLGVDELPILLSARRYPSNYAAPQRHAYGVPLLRHAGAQGSRQLLNYALGNFLLGYGGHGKRYAMNLEKLDDNYLELRHFGSEKFFNDDSLKEILAPFLSAAEASDDSHRTRKRHVLATFDLLAKWAKQIGPMIRCNWQEPSMFVTNHVFGEIYFGNEVLGDVNWGGTASYSIRTANETEDPAITNQAYPDLELSIAVLALDLAEMRGRKMGNFAIANGAFSNEIDVLTESLKNAGLLDPPPVLQSEFWQNDQLAKSGFQY